MTFARYLFKKIIFSFLAFIIAFFLSYVFFFVVFNNNQKSIIEGFFEFAKNIFYGFGKINNSTIATGFDNSLKLFWQYYQYSFFYIIITLVFSYLIGFFIGLIMGYKNGKLSDNILSLIVFGAVSIPVFILAPLLILVAQNNDLPILFIKASEYGISWMILSMIIPILLLSILPISFIATTTKNTIIKSLLEQYVLQMKAIGLSDYQIFKKAVLKNIIADFFAIFIPLLLITISFSFIIERIFQIPGQSLLIINMIEIKEINVLLTFIFWKLFIFLTLDWLNNTIYDTLNNLISTSITQSFWTKKVEYYFKKLIGRKIYE